MSNIISMTKIMDYLKQNPPEEESYILNNDRMPYKGIKEGIGKVVRNLKTADRIYEILPDEGEIILSSQSTTIMIVDENNRLVGAKYDIDEAKIVPISYDVITLIGYQHYSCLSIARFQDKDRSHGKSKHAAASFLEEIIKISDAPVVEIGNIKGDSFNREFPVKKYMSRLDYEDKEK